MSFDDGLARVKLEGELRDCQHAAHQLRQYLAGALCAECGEPLGSDEELMMDDEGRTLHQRCEPGNTQAARP